MSPAAGVSASPALPSGFRTTFGATINLTARDHDSRLVFDIRPVSSKPSPNDPYYLTPAGAFDAVMSSGAGQAVVANNLLCGLSGVEFVKLPSTGSQFVFKPQPARLCARLRGDRSAEPEAGGSRGGRRRPIESTRRTRNRIYSAAWASRFSQDAAEVRRYFPNGFPSDQTSTEQLDNLETVADVIAWMQNALQSQAGRNGVAQRLRHDIMDLDHGTAPAVPVYYAQPDEAVFYQAISNTGDEFVESIESPAVPLSSAPHAPAPAFPMMPYGGVRGSGMADYRILEAQVIAPLRRRQIHDIY